MPANVNYYLNEMGGAIVALTFEPVINPFPATFWECCYWDSRIPALFCLSGQITGPWIQGACFTHCEEDKCRYQGVIMTTQKSEGFVNYYNYAKRFTKNDNLSSVATIDHTDFMPEVISAIAQSEDPANITESDVLGIVYFPMSDRI